MNRKSVRYTLESAAYPQALITPLALSVCSPPAPAQGLEHGMKMMAELQGTDSSGLTLMAVSIFIIMGCALTLITITAMYTMKGKQKKR